MATVLRWYRVSDGVDVLCQSASGDLVTYHQQSGIIASNAEAQAFSDACEAASIAAQEPAVTITCEDGTVINA